jgi:uncharacterized membrane protein
MSRKLLDIASIIVLIAFLEVHFFQLAGADFPFYGLMKLAIIMNLVIPFMAIMVRLIDKVNNKVKKTPVIVCLERNRLYGSEETDTNLTEVNSEFSTTEHLIAHPEVFEKAFNKMIRLLLKDKGMMAMAPLVVLKLDLRLLSTIEQKELVKRCVSAGALDCILSDINASETDIEQSVRNFSLANFA